ncbi:SDR family oxidoreductase [Paraburkholderia sediminicola]|uniref:SDR family oxidoreductase n=1 Tax=Paraburkholderia sediminicola TaxID=458836 RepID=UPI000E749032
METSSELLNAEHGVARHAQQIVVVTGAARGIGLAIVRRFLSEGARVVMADLEQCGLDRALDELGPLAKGRVAVLAGDLSVEAGAQRLLTFTREQFSAPTVLVNNAGGGVILPFLSHTADTLRATIDRNLWTTIWCIRAFLPDLIASGHGRIVNLGADSVRNGLADHAAYNAAKGGVHGLTTGLAREYARVGLTVNTVAPCAVAGPALDIFSKEQPDVAQRFFDVIPMGRAAEPDEVSSMVSYLAAREAAFVTGQVISVNGGSTML